LSKSSSEESFEVIDPSSMVFEHKEDKDLWEHLELAGKKKKTEEKETKPEKKEDGMTLAEFLGQDGKSN
jgi:hypothetical protein